MTDLVAAVLGAAATRIRMLPPSRSAASTLSYGELARRVRATAASLARERDADRATACCSRCGPGPDAVVLALGIVEAGGTVVFADPGAGEALFRARAALAAPRWVAAESLLYLASSGPFRAAGAPPRSRAGALRPARARGAAPARGRVAAGGAARGAPLRRLSSAADSEACRTQRRATPVSDASHGRSSSSRTHHLHVAAPPTRPKAVVHSRAVARRRARRLRRRGRAARGPARADRPADGRHPGPDRRRPLDHAAAPARTRARAPSSTSALLPDAEVLFAVPAAADAILRALDARPELAPTKLQTIILGGAPVLRPLLAAHRDAVSGCRDPRRSTA